MKQILELSIFICFLILAYKVSTLTPIQENQTVNSASTDTWPIFIDALIWVESRGDDNAVGKNDDGGCLQITPVYIAEANRIIGTAGYYKIKDRFCREKSIEIFSVVNAFHNPEKNMTKALRLHNPRAGVDYHDKVMSKFNELIDND